MFPLFLEIPAQYPLEGASTVSGPACRSKTGLARTIYDQETYCAPVRSCSPFVL
jgi:hypothetical protein